jgi:hypothetical protein
VRGISKQRVEVIGETLIRGHVNRKTPSGTVKIQIKSSTPLVSRDTSIRVLVGRLLPLVLVLVLRVQILHRLIGTLLLRVLHCTGWVVWHASDVIRLLGKISRESRRLDWRIRIHSLLLLDRRDGGHPILASAVLHGTVLVRLIWDLQPIGVAAG